VDGLPTTSPNVGSPFPSIHDSCASQQASGSPSVKQLGAALADEVHERRATLAEELVGVAVHAPQAFVEVGYPHSAPSGVQAPPVGGKPVGQGVDRVPFRHWQFDSQPAMPPGQRSALEHAAPSVQVAASPQETKLFCQEFEIALQNHS
jgi:hypothetical protein